MELFFVHVKDIRSILFDRNIQIYNWSDCPLKTEMGKAGLSVTDILDFRESKITCFTHEDIIFINLWIASSVFFTKKIKTGINVGITKESLFRHSYEIINNIEHYTKKKIKYPTNVLQTMPSSVAFPVNKTKIDNFINNTLSLYRKKVIIPNGSVCSNQCPAFNLGNIVLDGGLIKKYPDVLFIFTAPFDSLGTLCLFKTSYSCDEIIDLSIKNIIFIDDIVDPPNLNEIDYLSRHCDILLTRASGPGCVYSTRDNYLDKFKTFISFTSGPGIAFEAMSTEEEISSTKWGGDQDKAKMIWSNNFSGENICSIIENEIIN